MWGMMQHDSMEQLIELIQRYNSLSDEKDRITNGGGSSYGDGVDDGDGLGDGNGYGHGLDNGNGYGDGNYVDSGGNDWGSGLCSDSTGGGWGDGGVFPGFGENTRWGD